MNTKTLRLPAFWTALLSAAPLACESPESPSPDSGVTHSEFSLPALAAQSASCEPGDDADGAKRVTLQSDALLLGQVAAIRAAVPDTIYGPFGVGIAPEECDEGALSPALVVELVGVELLHSNLGPTSVGSSVAVVIPHDVYMLWAARPMFHTDSVTWSSDGALGSLELGMSLGAWVHRDSMGDFVTLQPLFAVNADGRVSVQMPTDGAEHACPGGASNWHGQTLDDVRAQAATYDSIPEDLEARAERARLASLAMERAHFCASASELRQPCETDDGEGGRVAPFCTHPYFCNVATGLCEFRTSCVRSDPSSCPTGMTCIDDAEPYCGYAAERPGQ